MAYILVAIADPDERARAVFALRFAGYQVVTAATTQELIIGAKQVKPDLLLVDAHLPGLAGNAYEITFEKEASVTPVPVIYLLDSGEASKFLSDRDETPAGYLLRPISLDQLIRMVNSRLNKQG
jgi:DNA-binding response OmpR family regulator